MARSPLAVWLYGTRIGTLSEYGYQKLKFNYLPEAEEKFRPGSPVFSTSMPIDAQRRPNGVPVRIFFRGLLPESVGRARISEKFRISSDDDFGLLAAIGRDCAGAVVIQPEDEPIPGTSGRLIPMSDNDLDEAIRGIKDRPLGSEEGIRISLPGAQEKLVLARTPDGRWAWPADGAPSTHILKPQDMRYEAYAASEAFCLDLARSLNLTTIEAEVLVLAGRPTIVVSRYDRRSTQGRVTRIHQEDALQSNGKKEHKYEVSGGPSLQAFANVLSTHAGYRDLVKLLSLTTLNVVVGNADAHAKNFSILHLENGSIELAPAYDITPTTYYRNIPTSDGPRDLNDILGMKVNKKQSIHAITIEDLITEGRSWRLGVDDAQEIVHETIELIETFLDETAERAGIPDKMKTFVKERAQALADGKQANYFESSRSVRRARPSKAATGLERVPGGVPAGGQSTAQRRPEADIDLSET